MRPIDTWANPPAGPRGEARAEDAQDAGEFGDHLRAAAHRTNVATSAHSAPAPMPAARADADRSAQAPCEPRTAATSTPSATPRAGAAQAGSDKEIDPRDTRPHAHGRGLGRASERHARRHADAPQPPEGIALQTVLAAAHPLLAGTGDAAGAAGPTLSALTPHDVAASVTQAWLREPSPQDVAGGRAGAQWTFTLGDPLTPLAALRISGDATAGWGLQLTAGNGLPARELAAHAERLRRRLRARGQAVDRLEVDEDPHR